MTLIPTIRSFLTLFVFVIICFGVALFAAQFEPGEWYERLIKPRLTPPNWVFPPVWTLLYLMMAIAAWLVWRVADRKRVLPLTLFVVQLLLNATWSWLFFGLQKPGIAFIDIALLWLAIVLTTIAFWRVKIVAGVLLLPYLVWTTFAIYLNWEILRLNA